ncbi:hypothetical protein SynWH8101_1074 [Synechococcus sp. WH 8101]|nr:hypothetical protein SynWH8101_1074 [Synechococcus sp. WH 8101]
MDLPITKPYEQTGAKQGAEQSSEPSSQGRSVLCSRLGSVRSNNNFSVRF